MKARIGWRALARYVAGESPAQEATRIESWASSDARHAELLEEARRSWAAAGAADAPVDVDAAWRALSGRLATAPAGVTAVTPPARRPALRQPRVWGLALAAALAGVVALPVVRNRVGPEPQEGA